MKVLSAFFAGKRYGNTKTREIVFENGETYGSLVIIYNLFNTGKYVEGTDYMPTFEVRLYTSGTMYVDNGKLIDSDSESVSIKIYIAEN